MPHLKPFPDVNTRTQTQSAMGHTGAVHKVSDGPRASSPQNQHQESSTAGLILDKVADFAVNMLQHSHDDPNLAAHPIQLRDPEDSTDRHPHTGQRGNDGTEAQSLGADPVRLLNSAVNARPSQRNLSR